MIRLYTGTPGHGKTQRALFDLLNEPKYKGREVYVLNVRGLKLEDPRLTGWQELSAFDQWPTLPAGAIVLVDECHKKEFLPNRPIGSKVPEHIEALAEHRHKGLDFILVTQNAKNMDVFVRRLVDEHVHLKRVGQLSYTNVYTFQGTMEVDGNIPTDRALRHERWKLDKNIWTLYDSADEHTAKGKLPRIVYLVPVLAIAMLVVGVYIYKRAQEWGGKPAADSVLAKAGQSLPGGAPAPPGSGSQFQHVREFTQAVNEWQQSHVPLDPAYPETASLYDDVREVKTFPKLRGCIKTDTRCECFTQQGTTYETNQFTCHAYVQRARFDPYVDEKEQRQQADKARDKAQAPGEKKNCAPYLVTGLSGHTWTETRCEGYSISNAAPEGSKGATQAPNPTALPSTPRGGFIGG